MVTNTFMPGFLSMGKETFPVSLQHVFAANRKKLIAELRSKDQPDGVVFLKGGTNPGRNDTDHEPIFRQESYFWWLTGVKEPDCAVAVEVASGKTTLFIPFLEHDYATIMGPIKNPQQWKEHYQVDEVLYIEDIEKTLEKMLTDELLTSGNDAGTNGNPMISTSDSKLLLMRGLNTDSGNMYRPPEQLTETKNAVLQSRIDSKILFPILCECRVIKSDAELALMRHISEVTSFGHAYVMRNIKPGDMEYQGESLFLHYCYYNYGCRYQSYTPICGCGPNAAVLHYGHAGEPNNRQLEEDNICLFDMGAEYQGYASDITCSFPANGKFSEKQKEIYLGVLQAQKDVYEMLKPGVSYRDCHKTAEAALLRMLTKVGVVKPGGKTINELVDMRLSAVFMPCGLGHFIGCDFHDVGGYLPGHPERINSPGLRKLRTARILKEGMCLTVEPGCYFIDHLLNEALSEASPLQPYIDEDVVKGYRAFGGIRLEDVVVITKTGCINYTLCPRAINEVENVMAGGKWPPVKDEMPELRRERLTDPSPVPLPSPPSS